MSTNVSQMRGCPFCGSHNTLDRFTRGKRYVSAGCKNCGATGPEADDAQTESAVKLWNHLACLNPVTITSKDDVKWISILEDARTFGERLACVRKARGWTQLVLAKKCSLPPASINTFENNKRRPSFNSLRALSEVLGVSIDYLIGAKDLASYKE